MTIDELLDQLPLSYDVTAADNIKPNPSSEMTYVVKIVVNAIEYDVAKVTYDSAKNTVYIYRLGEP